MKHSDRAYDSIASHLHTTPLNPSVACVHLTIISLHGRNSAATQAAQYVQSSSIDDLALLMSLFPKSQHATPTLRIFTRRAMRRENETLLLKNDTLFRTHQQRQRKATQATRSRGNKKGRGGGGIYNRKLPHSTRYEQ